MLPVTHVEGSSRNTLSVDGKGGQGTVCRVRTGATGHEACYCSVISYHGTARHGPRCDEGGRFQEEPREYIITIIQAAMGGVWK